MEFKVMFVVFLVSFVRAEFADEDHFCSCIQSPQPLNSCIRMQSLTRNESHLILIERDNLYEIQHDWIDPRHSRMYLRWKVSQALLQPTKYEQVSWFIGSDRAMYESQIKPHGQLKYFGRYTIFDGGVVVLHYQFGQLFVHRIRHGIDMEMSDFQLSGYPGIPPVAGLPFSTVLNGHNYRDDYLLQTDVSRRRILFYDFLLDQPTPFVLKVKTHDSYNELTVYFVKASYDEFHQDGDDLLTTCGQPPFGVIVKNQVFLWDFITEKVYQFLYQRLSSQSGEPFKLQVIPMREYFRCSPNTGDELANRPDDRVEALTDGNSDWFLPALLGGILLSVVLQDTVVHRWTDAKNQEEQFYQ